MEKQKIFCKECGIHTNYVIDHFCKYHLKPYHNITTKEYYDKHIKKENEGKCIKCGKETRYYTYNKGYAEFCSLECLNKSEEMSKRVSDGKKDLDYNEVNRKIKETMVKRYGVEHALDNVDIRNKMNDNFIKKYGVKSSFNLPHVRKAGQDAINANFEEINTRRGESIKKSSKHALIKRKETVFNRYGVEHISQVKEFLNKARETIKLKYGFKTDDELKEFEKYRKEVRRSTNKVKSEIIKTGKCYYTNLNIDYGEKDAHNPFQATIDHKNSIIYGFKNKINPEIIGGIDNLCFCCRFVNSIKNFRCEMEFKNSKKFLKIIERANNGEFNGRL